MAESRRMHERYPCASPIYIAIQPRRKLRGNLINISRGGALFRIEGIIPVKEFELVVEHGSQKFSLKARILREAGRDAKNEKLYFYACTILDELRTRKNIEVLVDLIRTANRPAGKEVRDYWNLE